MRHLFSLVFLATLGVSALAQKNEIYIIAPERHSCMGEARHLCMKYTLENGESHTFYDGIAGFEYQWGHEVTIEVKSKKVKNPPADGSSVDYFLVKTISDVQVPNGSEFDIRMEKEGPNYPFFEMFHFNDGIYTLMLDVEIIENDLLHEVMKEVQADNLVVTFSHQDGKIQIERYKHGLY
jgi:hypothetical protein